MVPEYWYEATRHEDAISRGIADVSFVTSIDNSYRGTHGWMELKYRSLKPARASTVVRLEHFTDEQRAWLMSKGEHAGMTFLFLQLERDFLLYDHLSAQALGTLNTEDTYGAAIWFSKGKLDAAGLWQAILDTL